MKNYSLVVLLLFVIGGYAIYEKNVERTLAQDAAVRLEDRVDNTVREGGVLDSSDTVRIYSKNPGQSTIISVVPEGSRVKKGDLLIELDSSVIEDQLTQQRIQTAVAEADLAQANLELELKKLEESSVIAEAEATLRLARLAKEQASGEGGEVALQIRTMEKQLALLEKKTGLVKKQQAKNVESEHVALQYTLMLLDFESQSVIAKEKLEQLKTQVLPFQQESLQKDVVVAENQLKLKQLQLAANTREASDQLEARQVAAKIQQAQLEELQRQREHCNLYAPRDGIVVYANTSSRRAEPVTIEEGATVRERQVLLLMPNLEKLQVRVQVHESKIARVKKGQPVVIRFDALPNREYQGSVVSLSNLPSPSVWPNTEIKNYDVLVNLETPSPELKIGLTCLAEIDVSE